MALKYFIVTLGCQMNARDSETVAGMLEELGLSRAESKEDADLIYYNTCCVRENAENKALGNVIWLKELKAVKPSLLICVGGCMMQEEGMAERVKKAYPFVDLVIGTHNLDKLPELLRRAIYARERVFEVEADRGALFEGLPAKRNSKYKAYINVMYGCNNFCTYCIVPYVRGRERSRKLESVLDEAKRLLDSGVKELMLLGQNVNSYMGGGGSFAELLYRLDALGAPRVRFMTSHPKDLSDELIACFGELKSLCKQLHLPVQSGSDRILSLMNRRYTREKYLSLVERVRKVCPEIGLTSDIIVGFPGETEADFEDTLSLARAARFDAAYTFVYSPRPGTKAAEMPDATCEDEKRERILRLIAEQQRITFETCSSLVGREETVLVEGASAREGTDACGRTSRGHMVNFSGACAEGEFARVRIESAGKNTLRGKLI